MIQAVIQQPGGDRLEMARRDLLKGVIPSQRQIAASDSDSEKFDDARHRIHIALLRMDEELDALRQVVQSPHVRGEVVAEGDSL